MLQDVVDELEHAFFTFESAALDALETLGIGFFSEHFLFIIQHLLLLQVIQNIRLNTCIITCYPPIISKHQLPPPTEVRFRPFFLYALPAFKHVAWHLFFLHAFLQLLQASLSPRLEMAYFGRFGSLACLFMTVLSDCQMAEYFFPALPVLCSKRPLPWLLGDTSKKITGNGYLAQNMVYGQPTVCLLQTVTIIKRDRFHKLDGHFGLSLALGATPLHVLVVGFELLGVQAELAACLRLQTAECDVSLHQH